jgi:hypothetical protein
MNYYLLTASLLAFGIALAHSILGERYILIRWHIPSLLPTPV